MDMKQPEDLSKVLPSEELAKELSRELAEARLQAVDFCMRLSFVPSRMFGYKPCLADLQDIQLLAGILPSRVSAATERLQAALARGCLPGAARTFEELDEANDARMRICGESALMGLQPIAFWFREDCRQQQTELTFAMLTCNYSFADLRARRGTLPNHVFVLSPEAPGPAMHTVTYNASHAVVITPHDMQKVATADARRCLGNASGTRFVQIGRPQEVRRVRLAVIEADFNTALVQEWIIGQALDFECLQRTETLTASVVQGPAITPPFSRFHHRKRGSANWFRMSIGTTMFVGDQLLFYMLTGRSK